MARVLIGTAGWRYQHWVGPFYPQGTRLADRLAGYAGRVPAAEVNTTPREHMRGFGGARQGWEGLRGLSEGMTGSAEAAPAPPRDVFPGTRSLR